MPSPYYSVGESIVFSGCHSAAVVRPFVRPSVPTDIVITISDERLEQSL